MHVCHEGALMKKVIFLCKQENSALSEYACQTNHTIVLGNSRIVTNINLEILSMPSLLL